MGTALLQHGTAADDTASQKVLPGRGLRLRCPICAYALGAQDFSAQQSQPRCSLCGFIFRSENGIWRALAPSREHRYAQFVHQYEAIRSSEGRGSGGYHYYLALPYEDLTGRNKWQWKIRGRSFCHFERQILPRLQKNYPAGMDLLDIGAGNGWFSYRMAVKAHRPVAVDLLVNDLDGLGAARHYFHFLSQPFPCFQAEMDRLPFDDGQFDVVVFNASFHYSEDYTYTLGEALRCLRRPGHVLIIDSPFYRWEESGRQMVQERRAEFERKYGFRSDSVPSREYVTLHMLDELRNIHGIRWRILRPWYGLSWLIRPLRAKFRRRREPAQFFLVWGTIESP